MMQLQVVLPRSHRDGSLLRLHKPPTLWCCSSNMVEPQQQIVPDPGPPQIQTVQTAAAVRREPSQQQQLLHVNTLLAALAVHVVATLQVAWSLRCGRQVEATWWTWRVRSLVLCVAPDAASAPAGGVRSNSVAAADVAAAEPQAEQHCGTSPSSVSLTVRGRRAPPRSD